MTYTQSTNVTIADKAEKWAAEMARSSEALRYDPDTADAMPGTMRVAETLAECAAAALRTQDQQDTAMAWALAEICQIIGVDENTALDQLPDLVRAAVKRELLPIDEDNPPPHDEPLLLYHLDFMGREIYQAERFSTGERLSNGMSNYSQNAYATHYMPLPAPPKGDV